MFRRHASRRIIALFTAALPALALTQGTAQAQFTYIAQNNLVAIQFESAPLVDDWTLSTSTPGFTEDGYLRWDGPNLFNSPGASGIFGFDFEVQQNGNYQLRLRNRHENPDPTEENDVWIRMDGGQWIKTFSNMAGSVGAWTWESRFDFDHNNQPNANFNLTPGVHRIEFSGRSFGFKMDPLLTAFAPPYSTAPTRTSAAEDDGHGSEAWAQVVDDWDGAVARARASDQLLLVNFTGFN